MSSKRKATDSANSESAADTDDESEDAMIAEPVGRVHFVAFTCICRDGTHTAALQSSPKSLKALTQRTSVAKRYHHASAALVRLLSRRLRCQSPKRTPSLQSGYAVTHYYRGASKLPLNQVCSSPFRSLNGSKVATESFRPLWLLARLRSLILSKTSCWLSLAVALSVEATRCCLNKQFWSRLVAASFVQ